MGNKRNKGRKNSRKFNKPAGRHSWKFKKQLKLAYQRGEYLENVKYKNFKGPAYQIKSMKACVGGKPRVNFIVRRILVSVKRLKYKFIKSHENDTSGTFNKVEDPLDGSRIINLDLLKCHVTTITSHSALCDKARNTATKGNSPISIVSEERHGFASVLKAKCNGCGKIFELNNSECLETSGGKQYEVNVRGVWGSMVTGGGCSSLNECFGTMGIPTLNEGQYSKMEMLIGNWWRDALEEEMLKAGEEEKALAIESNDFYEGVPAITVVCDGGWSKRSHKHTYNAMGGVGVIFGHRTKKLLHIGVRNRLCYICSQAQTKNIEPKPHDCYKNWSDSAQSMESDIILEGFLSAESKHGVRYMRLIGDGDSSTLQDIMESVPVWGQHVKKLECANHACKCLRSNLEQLVNDKPAYKGKGKITKLARIKITTAVRCAIKMRSQETDKNQATKKLKKDIKNAGRHVLGLHDLCSTDFCKYKDTGKNQDENEENDKEDEDKDDDDLFLNNENYWKDSVKDISEVEEKSIRKGGKMRNCIDEQMLKDLFFYLNRLSEKADRLIGNFTSNLAESWMHVRCKFDGGKMNNKCFRASFYARCYGGALRSAKGPAWSPMVYQQVTGKRPDSIYIKTYRLRSKKHVNSLKSQNKQSNKDRKRKRKLEINKQSTSKIAKLKYGKDILDDRNDLSEEELREEMNRYYENSVKVTSKEVEHIEHETRDQSLNEMWFKERKKRLTSSIFGDIISRGVNNNRINLTQRLLYTKFTGNKYTRKGLSEESITIEEYENHMKAKGINCKVVKTGLKIWEPNPFLGATSDGIIKLDDGTEGLIEIKNLLQTESTLIKDAAKHKKNFCLSNTDNNNIQLKRNHKYYYQIQGQLNIHEKQWCDLVIRRTNPYDIYIERIERDIRLWTNKMVPKLSAFYFSHVLPELAVPRYRTVTGIRKPPIPWYNQEQKFNSTGVSRLSSNQESVSLEEQILKTKKANATQIKPHNTVQDETRCKPDQTSGNVHTTIVDVKNTKRPVTGNNRSKRQPKVKFVGRRISHLWDNVRYTGNVLSLISGQDGQASAIYDIHYDQDNAAYEVENLLDDYLKGELKFLDI